MELDAATLKQVLRFQYLELTEALIYERLARRERNPANRKVLQQIASDEVRHYEFWKEYSGQEVAPSRLRVEWFSLLARLFGITFCVNLLERDEVNIAAEGMMLCAKPGEYQPASTAPVEMASHISLPPTMALGSLNSMVRSPLVSSAT